MTRLGTSILALAICLGAVPNAQCQIVNYTANFSGPNESPPNASPGTGSGTVVYNSLLHTLALNASFSGLTGTTTASHIHAATVVPGAGTAGVATQTPSFANFPLGVTAGTFSQTLDLTLASSYNASYITANGGTTSSAELALISAFNGGQAYWNIHSSTFPGGEIRGFITPVPVPEPGSMALCAISVGAFGYLRNRRKK